MVILGGTMRTHIGGMGRCAARAVLAALLVIGATASPAAAHGNGSNGCSLSPDSGRFPVAYDFHGACDRHDRCYDELWFGKGTYDLLNYGWTGRLACDGVFLQEMRTSCRIGHGPGLARKACEAIARTYFIAVRTFGASHFDNPALN